MNIVQITHHVRTFILSLQLSLGCRYTCFLFDILVEIFHFHSVLSLRDAVNYCNVGHRLILLMQGHRIALARIVRVLHGRFCRCLSVVKIMAAPLIFSATLPYMIWFDLLRQLLLQSQLFQFICHPSTLCNWRTFEILS